MGESSPSLSGPHGRMQSGLSPRGTNGFEISYSFRAGSDFPSETECNACQREHRCIGLTGPITPAAGQGKTMAPVVLPTADAVPRRVRGGRSEPFPTRRAAGPRIVEGRRPFWRPALLAVAGPRPPHDP